MATEVARPRVTSDARIRLRNRDMDMGSTPSQSWMVATSTSPPGAPRAERPHLECHRSMVVANNRPGNFRPGGESLHGLDQFLFREAHLGGAGVLVGVGPVAERHHDDRPVALLVEAEDLVELLRIETFHRA